MKTKTPELVPDVYQKKDEIYVAIRLPKQPCTSITVKRSKTGGVFHPRWSAKAKATVSWSGGNGQQTPEDAELMARAIRWAASIARNLNVRNPSNLTKQDLLMVHY